MPPLPGTDSPNAGRLAIGQGVKGGIAPPGAAPRGLPAVPVGVPHIHPEVNTQPFLPLNAPGVGGGAVDLPQTRAPASNEPIPRPVAPQYKGEAYLRRLAPIQPTQPLDRAGKKALAAIKDPINKYDPGDNTTNRLVLNPSPALHQAILDQGLTDHHYALQTSIYHNAGVSAPPNPWVQPHPTLGPGQADPAVVDHLMARNNQQLPAGRTSYPATSGLGEFAREQESNMPTRAQAAGLNPKDLATLQASGASEAALLPSSPAAVIPKLASQTAGMMIGLGPGMYHLAGSFIHDPTGTTAKFAQAIAHSYGTTINHPERQLANDPLSFVMNVLTPMFAGAGATARVGELSRTADALRAGEITKAQAVVQIGKTLMRPHVMQREINAGGVRVNPPAFGSSLGGYMQTKLLDPLFERNVTRAAEGTGKTLPWTGRKAGNMVRRDFEQKAEQIKNVMATRGASPEQASAIGAMETHGQIWKKLYDNGAGYDESYAHNPGGYVAIKRMPDKRPNYKQYGSSSSIADRFKSMVETDPEKIHANPMDYKFIPKSVWNHMGLYRPMTGPGAGTLNAINNVSQLVRSGRLLHPGYVAWAAQNGLLHLSDAGAHVFRNAWQLRNEFSRLTPAEQGMMDGAVGNTGVAGATVGKAADAAQKTGLLGRYYGVTRNAAKFWNKVDDQWARRMSMIHHLNAEGYHSAEDWSNLMKQNPTKFNTIGRRAGQRMVDYTEMTPAERNTLAKLATAYGWTRGASTFAARFPLEHPIQARLGAETGQEGESRVASFYAGVNGMVPNWLRGYLPLGHGDSPWLLSGSVVNPAETLGNVIDETPGLAGKGQTENFLSQAAPATGSLMEAVSGTDAFGNALKGSDRYQKPVADLLKRFEPISAAENLLQSKKGGGTFVQGPKEAGAGWLGTGLQHLSSIKKTAALGMKDYEQSLSKPDEINFRYAHSVAQLPQEANLLAQHGMTMQQLEPLMGKVRGDLEMVHMRDLYQTHFAEQHGSKAWRSLPAKNKLSATITFIQQHHIMPASSTARFQQVAGQMTDDKQIEALTSELWQATGIGAVANQWKSAIKQVQPPTLTKARP